MPHSKPKVLTKCVANQHTGAHERIIEFSFPYHADWTRLPGGLIRFHDRAGQTEEDGSPRKPLVEIYRTDGQVEVIAPAPQMQHQGVLWAAFVGNAHGQSITHHRTYREALEAVADALWGEQTSDPGDSDPAEQTDEELAEAITDHCNSCPDDFYITEVTLP